MKKQVFDERQVEIFKSLSTKFFIFTMVYLWVDILIRSLILKQESSAYEDLSILYVINAVGFIPLYLYFSGVSVKKVKPLILVGLYFIMVIIGIIVTGFRYNNFSLMFLLEKSLIISAILAILFTLYIIFAFFGYNKIKKDIEE